VNRKAILAVILVLAAMAVIGSIFTRDSLIISRERHVLAPTPRNNFSTVSRDKNLTVAANRTVNGDVLVIGANALISGTVKGSVIVRNGDLTVFPGGKIQGDAVAIGGQLHVANNAMVSGKRISAERSVFGFPGGPPRTEAVHGRGFGPRAYRFGPGPAQGFEPRFFLGAGIRLFFMLLTLGIFIGSSILFARARPQLLKQTGNAIVERTLITVLVGSAVLAILFVTINVLRVFVGFQVVALLGFVLGIIMLIAAIIPAHMVGLSVGKSLSEKSGFVKQTALGALLVGLFIFLPLIGSVVLIACAALGIGALALTIRRPAEISADKME